MIPRAPRSASGLLRTAFFLAALSASVVAAVSIPPDHPLILLSDFVAKATAPDGAVRLHRILDVPGRGYRWDNPGARVQFRTDARAVTVRLRYSDQHASPSARAPVGIFLIDERGAETWTFTTRSTATRRAVEDVAVTLPAPPDSRAHDYAIVLPYGDSVDFCGLSLSDGASLQPPPARPAFRYVAYGDSVTHGFSASRIDRTFVYQIAERNGWQSVNLGLGGRTARPAEGVVIGDLGGDLASIFIGVNDWQTGVEPSTYRENMRGLIAGVRLRQPRVPLCVITPLWVSEKWRPERARFPLETYRTALRELVAALADPALILVEGPELIDPDERNFDPVLVHPNDRGFAQMADRLAPRLQAALAAARDARTGVQLPVRN